MNVENDGNDDAIADELPRADIPLLHDLEHYIRINGIAQEAAGPNLNELEEARRFSEFEAYQKSVLKSIFDEEEEDGKQDEDARKKQAFLKKCKSGKLKLITAKGSVIEDLPLFLMASTCDTIFSIASSKLTYDPSLKVLCFDLQHFEHAPVQIFINILFRRTKIEEIHDDYIIDCLKVSHYLQCREIYEPITDIIEASIDAQNCLSICQLADQLQISSLFESSLSFMVGTFDNIQNHELWEELPTILQNRILTMRSAVQSSIVGRGNKSKVFFHSTDEFLAIFSDSIREQKERLGEAKLRQEEIIQERNVRGGRHRDPMGGSVRDAALKIAKQESRIQTLECFFKEQKLIFASNGRSDKNLIL